MPLPTEYRKTTFLILGSISLGIAALLLISYNYLLIRAHITPIFWAIVTYLILKAFRRPIVYYLEAISSHVPFKLKVIFWVLEFAATITYLYFIVSIWLDLDNVQRFWHILSLILLCIFFLIPNIVDFDVLAMILIFCLLLFVILFIGGFVVKKCYDESLIVTRKFGDFVDFQRSRFVTANSNSTLDIWNTGTKICHFFVGFATKNSYFSFIKLKTEKEYCDDNILFLRSNIEEIGMNVATWLGSHVGLIGMGFTNFFKSTYDFISSVGEFFFSMFLFISLLYYFVKYESDIESELADLSPLTPGESKRLIGKLNERVVMTFYYAGLLAFVRFTVTLISFWMVQIEVLWIFAFLSGFLAIVPVFSSWLIWVPTTCFLMIRDGVWSYTWIFMLLVNLFPAVIDSYVLLPIFEDQYPDILGLSIILGVYTFGWSGVLIGPLLFASSIGLKEIYKNYMQLEYAKVKRVRDLRKAAHLTPVTPDSFATPITPLKHLFDD